MKNQKLLVYSALLLASLFAFTACKKTTSTNTSIVGTWEATSATDVLTDSTTTPFTVINFDTTYINGHSPLVIQFNSNNTYINTDHSVTPVDTIEIGVYTILSSSKILRVGGGASDTVTYSLSNNTLTLQELQHSPGQSDFGTTVCARQ